MIQVKDSAQGYFYPRSPCGERPLRKYPVILGSVISIHALLAESDTTHMSKRLIQFGFLSTLSLRRATRCHRRDNGSPIHFYPRSPCGERPIMDNIVFMPREFLSTLSLRRATAGKHAQRPTQQDFYPRSPCGERPNNQPEQQEQRDFYPRSPCGERLHPKYPKGYRWQFLSTLSLRRATFVCIPLPALILQFLSTLSLRRATDYNKSILLHLKYFYPRSPCGERLMMD